MGSPTPLRLAVPAFLSYGWALVPIRRGEKAPDLDLLRDMYGDTRIVHLRQAPALAGEVELWFENALRWLQWEVRSHLRRRLKMPRRLGRHPRLHVVRLRS